MSLSLEVKKFKNSEQTGEYAEVTLPAELPVEREELRTVHRDNMAAENAARAAAAVAQELDETEKAKERAAKALEDACREETSAAERLNEKQSAEAGIMDEYDSKNAAADKAKSEYETAKAKSDVLIASYKEAEQTRLNAENAYAAANSSSAAKNASNEAAKTAAEDAAANEAALTEKAENMRSAYAEAETISEKAEAKLKAAQDEEKEASEKFAAISEESVKLAGEKKLREKELRDAEKDELKFSRELAKIKSTYDAAAQHCDALKTRCEASQGSQKEKDALKLKSNIAASKAEILKSSVDEKQSQYDNAADAAAQAKAAFNESESKLAENAEQLNAARTEYDAAKQRTAEANEANIAEKAKFAGLAASVADLTEQRQKAADQVNESKNAQQLASGESAAAEAEAERLKAAVEKAQEDAEKKKTTADQAKAVTDAAEKEYTIRKAEFDSVNAVKANLTAEKEAAGAALTEKQNNVKQLQNELNDITDEVERLKSDAADGQADAERLRGSVHVIEVKYEKAKIHYMESGKGEPIILIHSVGQSLYTFRKLFYKLALSYRVIALDLAGHGYSERPYIFEYGIADHAECIARFMDVLGIRSAHILAFSMGAAYAMELALLHPEKVEKIVLLTPGGVTSEMPLFVRMMENGLLGGISSKLYGLKGVRKLIDDSLFDHTVMNDEDVLEYYRPASDPDGRFAIRCSIGNYNENELIKAARDISAETLIIWGTDDKLHGIETAESYNSVIQNSKLIKVLNAGHLIHEEKPDKIYSLVKNFIPAGYDNEEE